MQLSTHTQISGRQLRLYQFIRRYQAREGRPPTYAEMQAALGISSKSLVRYHLDALVRQGYLERAPSVARGARPSVDARRGSFPIPVAGHLENGEPVLEHAGDRAVVEALELTRAIIREEDGLYALRVRGNSMLDVLLRDGDIAVMKPCERPRDGDLVVAHLRRGNEHVVKRWQGNAGCVRLSSDDKSHAPIEVPADGVDVLGAVVAVIRQM